MGVAPHWTNRAVLFLVVAFLASFLHLVKRDLFDERVLLNTFADRLADSDDATQLTPPSAQQPSSNTSRAVTELSSDEHYRRPAVSLASALRHRPADNASSSRSHESLGAVSSRSGRFLDGLLLGPAETGSSVASIEHDTVSPAPPQRAAPRLGRNAITDERSSSSNWHSLTPTTRSQAVASRMAFVLLLPDVCALLIDFVLHHVLKLGDQHRLLVCFALSFSFYAAYWPTLPPAYPSIHFSALLFLRLASTVHPHRILSQVFAIQGPSATPDYGVVVWLLLFALPQMLVSCVYAFGDLTASFMHSYVATVTTVVLATVGSWLACRAPAVSSTPPATARVVAHASSRPRLVSTVCVDLLLASQLYDRAVYYTFGALRFGLRVGTDSGTVYIGYYTVRATANFVYHTMDLLLTHRHLNVRRAFAVASLLVSLLLTIVCKAVLWAMMIADVRAPVVYSLCVSLSGVIEIAFVTASLASLNTYQPVEVRLLQLHDSERRSRSPAVHCALEDTRGARRGAFAFLVLLLQTLMLAALVRFDAFVFLLPVELLLLVAVLALCMAALLGW